MSDEFEVTQAEVPEADQEEAQEVEPVYDHTALSIFKDKKDNQWKVAQIQFNTDGDTGKYEVIKESGFRGEAIEWYKILTAKMFL